MDIVTIKYSLPCDTLKISALSALLKLIVVLVLLVVSVSKAIGSRTILVTKAIEGGDY